MNRCWRVDDGYQTLALASENGDMPEVIYWGAALPGGEDLGDLMAAHERGISAAMPDRPVPLGLCPVEGNSFPGQAGLVVARADGAPLHPRFHFESVQLDDTLTLRYCDEALALRYIVRITPDHETHLLTLTATLQSQSPVRVHWFAAPVLPAPDLAREMIDFSGRWCGEFQPVHTPFSPGIRLRESRTGRSGPEHFPGLIVPIGGATDTAGTAFAFHYGWSGGHRMVVEELPDGRRQIQFGHAPGSERVCATLFQTAPLYATWSGAGLNGCATAFQRHVRKRIVKWAVPARPRPVHYNCWEAVYFDQTPTALMDIASRAAALGGERFVLDDGWFGRRDDDTSSLGDWQVDRRKWPDGLAPFIAHVHRLGMGFGLWVEPEMTNPDSALFRAHPDWVLGDADQTLTRHQMVLDMSREDVRDHLFKCLSALLSSYRIDYIKWDHNRTLPFPDAAQTRGTYALLDRLGAAFSHVEWESCASGGGRIDFGILARTQRVWLSDSNDAIERLRIQHDAALFLPAAITGSHVGPRKCHTSGRILGMELRAWTAAQRHMGIECDPRELTPAEAATLKDVITWWKANRDWTMRADILRLDSGDPTLIAEQHLACDGARFVVFAARLGPSAQISPRPLPLTCLDSVARYQISLRNRASLSPLARGIPALQKRVLRLSGQALMSGGINLAWVLPETIQIIEGRRL